MIVRLSQGPATVGELGGPFPITKPAVTKHVKLLERAGFVRRHRAGRKHRLTLRREPMEQAVHWIDRHRRFWEASLDSLAEYVDEINRPSGEEK